MSIIIIKYIYILNMNRNIIIAIVLLITLIFLLIMIPKELYTPEPVKLNPIPDYYYIDYDTKIHDEWFEAEHHIEIYKKKETEILGLSNNYLNIYLVKVFTKLLKTTLKISQKVNLLVMMKN